MPPWCCSLDQLGNIDDSIALLDSHIMLTRQSNGATQSSEAFDIIGPDTGLEPTNLFVLVNIDGSGIEPERPGNTW